MMNDVRLFSRVLVLGNSICIDKRQSIQLCSPHTGPWRRYWLVDKLECVDKFCYLSDLICARGAEKAYRVRLCCDWARFRELVPVRSGASFKVKGMQGLYSEYLSIWERNLGCDSGGNGKIGDWRERNEWWSGVWVVFTRRVERQVLNSKVSLVLNALQMWYDAADCSS